MESSGEYLRTSDLVGIAKEACHITKLNTEMGEDEIRTVVRWIGEQSPDTRWVDGKPVIGRIGIDMMLSITIMEFPLFYMWHKLSQWN